MLLPFLYLFVTCHISHANVDSTVANKKVGVKEVVFDSPVSNIVWLEKNHMTVILTTQGGRLYMSRNGGDEWNDITSNFKPSKASFSITYQDSDVDDSPAITVKHIYANPNDKNVLVVVGTKRNHFITEDAGRTWRILRQKSAIHSYIFHPTESKWALLSTWTDSCDPAKSLIASKHTLPCQHMLYVTKNSGRSFKLVVNYVVQFAWATTLPNRIFFSHHKRKLGTQPKLSLWSKDVDFGFTDDFGQSHRTILSGGNKFLVSNNYVFVARLKDSNSQTVELAISSDYGTSFDQAQLPVDLEEKSYTILDTSEGAVIIHVNHGVDSNVGNVYVSDETGLRYALSLANNIRGFSGDCEFDKVLSLEGVYMANFKYKETVHYSDEENSEEETEKNDRSQLSSRSERRKFMKSKDETNQQRTVISFDKGGVWQYLSPPKVDSSGKKITCPDPDKCWLHLHGVTNYKNYAPFYSVDNALGIIMGTGNIGASLQSNLDEVNTYLSRDGGLSWVEAHKGAYIYEFSDHGGLIVMADDFRKTSQVVFSWNEGASWYDFDITGDPIDVDNIVTEPNSTSTKFMMYGTRGSAGVLYHLDFSALNQPTCKGIWAADSVSSDYEKWTPSDGKSETQCLLGRSITYTRRKSSSECFNGELFERPTQRTICECTMEDFECELGFYRKVGNLKCIPNDEIVYNGQTNNLLLNSIISKHCAEGGGTYWADAYRKVPGDSCQGGWSPTKVQMPCPMMVGGFGGFSRIALWIFSIVFVIILVMIGFGVLNTKFPGLINFNLGLDTFTYVKYNAIRKKISRKNSNTNLKQMDTFSPHVDDDPFFDDNENTEEGVAPQLVISTRVFDDDEEDVDSTTFVHFDSANKDNSFSMVNKIYDVAKSFSPNHIKTITQRMPKFDLMRNVNSLAEMNPRRQFDMDYISLCALSVVSISPHVANKIGMMFKAYKRTSSLERLGRYLTRRIRKRHSSEIPQILPTDLASPMDESELSDQAGPTMSKIERFMNSPSFDGLRQACPDVFNADEVPSDSEIARLQLSHQEDEKTNLVYINYSLEVCLSYLPVRFINHYACNFRVLLEIRKRMGKKFTPTSMLDVGSGPGTSVIAASEVFGGLSEAFQDGIVCIEPSENMSELASFLLADYANSNFEYKGVGRAKSKGKRMSDLLTKIEYLSNHNTVNTTTDRVSITMAKSLYDLPLDLKFDLITLSYVQSEIRGQASRDMLIRQLWNRLTPGKGILVLIESGTPFGFRLMHSAREMLIKNIHPESLNLIAPCPHTGVCPLALTGRDWCHFYQRAFRLPTSVFLRGADKSKLFEKNTFSYLVTQKAMGPRFLYETVDDAPTASEKSFFWPRIINRPIKAGGHTLIDLCSPPNNLERVSTTRSDPSDGGFKISRQYESGDLWRYPKRIIRREARAYLSSNIESRMDSLAKIAQDTFSETHSNTTNKLQDEISRIISDLRNRSRQGDTNVKDNTDLRPSIRDTNGSDEYEERIRKMKENVFSKNSFNST